MPNYNKLASVENVLKGDLAAAWSALDGQPSNYTDLGIARRFGGAAAAYSLRDIGAMNGRVVKVRRDLAGEEADAEEDFSASQVQSGALENWVNGKLENTLPADVATSAAAYSLRKVKASYASNAVRIRRSSDDVEVDVAFDSDDKVSASSAITNPEQGGEIYQITATTLGVFLNENTPDGDSAFVHTWYDQAGSNNAVQATDANQPKIASDGALLDDGLDFDGSNDFLESTTLSSIYTGTDTVSSAFILVNSDAASTTQYIIGAGSTSSSNPMYNTLFHSGGNIGWQARDDAGTLKSNLSATPYVANQMYLVSNINSGTTTDFNSNAVIKDNGADSDVGAKTINTVKLGARGNGSTSPLDGSIKEAIFYATDQSNNRFKIESNINNYYGLYNDANETSATEFSFLNQRSGGVTVSNGVSGLTLDVETASAFAGFQLKEKVIVDDIIYLSFNADLTGGSGGTASPKVALRETSISNTVRSNQFDITEGFNTVELTSTNANAEYLVFSEGDDNRIFTISDLKVSRIERNGFVQTWYDQSSNSRPLIQTTATEQPSIVENGGFVGGVKANVATSDNTMQNLQVSTDGLTPNFGTDDWASGANSKLGLMYVGKINDSASSSTDSIIWGGGRGVSSYQAGGLSLQVIKGGDDDYKVMNERQGLTPARTAVTITLNTDDDMILYGTADNRDFTLKLNSTTSSETESADLDTRENQALSLFGSYSGFNTRRYQNSSAGVCKECYLFAGDNISEVDAISTEINNHYNIY